MSTSAATPHPGTAAASDGTLHPVIAPLVAKLAAETRTKIRHVISRASAEGFTTYQVARQIRELGVDSKAAKAIARTGLAAIADRTR